MNLILTRNQFRPDGIFGFLKDFSGNQIAVTLEHAYTDSGIWVPKLPDGTFICKRRLSPRFGYELFQIMGVPGHNFIEIHIGNYNEDSSGCVLLGEAIVSLNGSQALSMSRAAFLNFMHLLSGINQFSLEVSSL